MFLVKEKLLTQKDLKSQISIKNVGLYWAITKNSCSWHQLL